MQENKTTTKLLKRIEILGEAVQTALEAVLEIQVAQIRKKRGAKGYKMRPKSCLFYRKSLLYTLVLKDYKAIPAFSSLASCIV